MKTETEIRERIKELEDYLPEIEKLADESPTESRIGLLKTTYAQIAILNWVLNETK